MPVLDKIYLTWTQYIEYLIVMAGEATAYDVNVVIGLTRGGLTPGVVISHKLDVPMFAFDPHVLHSNGEERDRVQLPISPLFVKSILIVDDITDTGKTFNKCTKFFNKRGFNCFTMSVFINKMTTTFKPNYGGLDSEKRWVVFPYEME